MDHVNNAVYADWVEEQVLAGGGPTDVRAIPRRLGLEYARAAAAGSTVSATTWREPGGRWACRIADPDGSDVLRARLSSGR